MSVVEIIYISGVVATILSFLGAGYNGAQYIRYKKQFYFWANKRSKKKKRKKQIARKRNFFSLGKKQKIKRTIIFLILGLALAAGSGYASYYQSMNLTADDSDAVVKGYYLLRDFETQVKSAKEQSIEEEKIQENIRYLATSLASYGTKKASDLNSKKGQLTLNRYYNTLKELGMNASTRTNNFFGNEQLAEEFLSDIVKVKGYEKNAFDYYKVNTDNFSEEN